MVIGPVVGAAVIRGADTYHEDLGQRRQVPTPAIFVAAALVGVLALVPMLALHRAEVRATDPGGRGGGRGWPTGPRRPPGPAPPA
jgi:ABC-type branched-subunit amino acid transport system permease subunit